MWRTAQSVSLTAQTCSFCTRHLRRTHAQHEAWDPTALNGFDELGSAKELTALGQQEMWTRWGQAAGRAFTAGAIPWLPLSCHYTPSITVTSCPRAAACHSLWSHVWLLQTAVASHRHERCETSAHIHESTPRRCCRQSKGAHLAVGPLADEGMHLLRLLRGGDLASTDGPHLAPRTPPRVTATATGRCHQPSHTSSPTHRGAWSGCTPRARRPQGLPWRETPIAGARLNHVMYVQCLLSSRERNFPQRKFTFANLSAVNQRCTISSACRRTILCTALCLVSMPILCKQRWLNFVRMQHSICDCQDKALCRGVEFKHSIRD